VNPNRQAPIFTKILATLGPATASPDTIKRLIEEGARVFRINFSHGKVEEFAKLLRLVRSVSKDVGVPVAALGDLCGPKIRCTGVRGGTLELHAGDHVEITQRELDAYRDEASGVVTIATTYPQMVDDAQPGQRLLINDGAIRMLITDKVEATDPDENGRRPDDPRLICCVLVGGVLSPKKGINLPDSALSAPSLTEWDKECAAFAVAEGFDYVALSFVRCADDVAMLKALLHGHAKDAGRDSERRHTPIIAKIEMPQAIAALDEIIAVSDGVMVARGDLGVEMDLARVPILQKQIVQKAHEHGKLAIVATQMLESMIENASPTRAEVGDVANAVIDGADAVMLSGETAVGKHPIRAVNYMARTAAQAESYLAEDRHANAPQPTRSIHSRYRPEALSKGVAVIVRELQAKCVVMWTHTGGGVKHLSQNRLSVPIVALCPNDWALRRMSLMYGVRPVEVELPEAPEQLMKISDDILMSRKWAQPGDPIVVVRGWPMGVAGTTNTVQVHYVADVCRI